MNLAELEAKANDIRKDIVSMIAQAGSGHPGGSLSIAEIMTALYFGGVMKHDSQNPTDPTRDRFVLSKGHAAPALYAALAHAGYFPCDELSSLRKFGTRLQGHPDSNKLPGVEVCTGSLGQGLSIAAGMACGLRLENNPAQVFTVLGDGECQEGQVWEAAMFAAHQKLGNLIAVVDYNRLQIDGCVDEVCSPSSLEEKFAAFGWDVISTQGNDMAAIQAVLLEARDKHTSAPCAIIAHTTKGKGVSFMEDNAGWHGKAPSAEQCEQALSELDQKETCHG